MEYAAIIGAVVAAVSALVTSLIAAGQQGEAMAVRQRAAASFGDEILPHLDKAVAEQQASSNFNGIREDDGLRGQQLRAIRELENTYQNEGMSQADTAALNRAQTTAAGQATSQYGAMTQALAARGQSMNSGAALAASMQSQQNATNATGSMAGDAMIAARQRALQALEASSQIAGQVRESDWSHNAQRAQAQDAINAFNTALRDKANYYNLELPQRQFDNRMSLNTARANALNGVAAGYDRGAQTTNSVGAGIGNSLATGITNYQPRSSSYSIPDTTLYNLSNNPYPTPDEWAAYPKG
jgi:hypothetical protein